MSMEEMFFNFAASGAPLLPAISGLVADYAFTEGSGTVAHDTSGLSNDGTLGAGGEAPTWSSSGLVFAGGQKVSIPVAATSAVSVIAVVAQSNTANAPFTAVLGSDTTSGVQRFLLGPAPMRALPVTLYVAYPTAWVGNVVIQGKSLGIPGTICGFVSDSQDRLYLGGVQVGYAPGTATTSAALLGNLSIGASPAYGYGNTGFTGTITRVLIYNRALTSPEVAQLSSYLAPYAASRGLPAPYQNATSSRVLIGLGDSITYGLGLGSSWFGDMTLGHTYQRWNLGVSGMLAFEAAQNFPVTVPPLFSLTSAKTAIVIFLGTNDIANSRTPAQAFASLQSIVTQANALTPNLVIVPMLSRTGSGFDAAKNTYNGLISGASWPVGTSVIPTSSLPDLVPDGSSTNTTYFQDGTHPTSVGAAEIGTAVATAVNSFG